MDIMDNVHKKKHEDAMRVTRKRLTDEAAMKGVKLTKIKSEYIISLTSFKLFFLSNNR
jgi:hypothetical protein